MAHSNVSNCVLSIVTSFTNGLDVFKKLRKRKRQTKRSKREKAANGGEELRLSKSLRQGPQEIGREYQKSMQAVGDHYAIGDAVAQTSLAAILLKLNTGLVGIITNFLDRGKQDAHPDYRSLTDLSEKSRCETLGVLRQLYLRMQGVRPALGAIDNNAYEYSAGQRLSEDRSRAIEQQTRPGRHREKHRKARGPTLARVVIQNSSQPSQLALVKSSARKKTPRLPPGSANTNDQATSASAYQHAPIEPTARPPNNRSKTAPPIAPDQFKDARSTLALSLPSVPPKPDRLRSSRSVPRLQKPLSPQQPPPLPPKLPENPFPPLRQLEMRHRKQTPTFYSIASASTKMGEIPVQKWRDPWDYGAMDVLNAEAEEQGWPFRDADGVGSVSKQKRTGFFRMFRRRMLSG